MILEMGSNNTFDSAGDKPTDDMRVLSTPNPREISSNGRDPASIFSMNYQEACDTHDQAITKAVLSDDRSTWQREATIAARALARIIQLEGGRT